MGYIVFKGEIDEGSVAANKVIKKGGLMKIDRQLTSSKGGS